MRKVNTAIFFLASILMTLAVLHVSGNPVDIGGPVGWWKFDEGSGLLGFDSSGNGNNGIIENATYTVDTPIPYASNFALEFSGEIGPQVPAYSYVTIPDNTSLRPSSAITLEAWIKPYSPQGRHIVAKEYGDSNLDSYALWFDWSGNIRFAIEQVGYSVAAPIPTLNDWHHVAGVWNGSIKRLYVDGIEVANRSFSGPIPYDSNPVLIGADDNDGDDVPDEVWNGIIDEVRIYNYSRTSEQIQRDASIPWDITGPTMWVPDKKCDIRDVAIVALRFGSEEGDGEYDVRADITGPNYLVPDGKIDIRDVALVAIHFGEEYP